MTTLAVLGGLALLLFLACVRESRRGTPEWGRRPVPERDAASEVKRGTAAALGLGAMEIGGGGDG